MGQGEAEIQARLEEIGHPFGLRPGAGPSAEEMHRAPDNRPPERRGLFLCTLSGLDRAGSSLRAGPRLRALGVSAVRSLRNPTSVRRLPVEGLAWLLE